MRFFDFVPAYSYFRQRRMNWADRLQPADWIREFLPHVDGHMVQEVYRIGCLWILARRPYYSVYPAIAESLCKVPLDIDASQVKLPLPTLLVRFAEQHAMSVGGRELQAFLVHARDEGLELIASCKPKAGLPNDYCAAVLLDEGLTVETAIELLVAEEAGPPGSPAIIEACARVIVAICMMRQDPDLIVPDVLSADAAEFERTGDGKFVERAQRRGKIGWIVGSRVELSPHSRRPYWGWRWIGPGRTVRQLRPVRGCFVKRKRVTEVPTGYLDDEPDGQRDSWALDDVRSSDGRSNSSSRK